MGSSRARGVKACEQPSSAQNHIQALVRHTGTYMGPYGPVGPKNDPQIWCRYWIWSFLKIKRHVFRTAIRMFLFWVQWPQMISSKYKEKRNFWHDRTKRTSLQTNKEWICFRVNIAISNNKQKQTILFFVSGRICLPGQVLDSWTATGQFLESWTATTQFLIRTFCLTWWRVGFISLRPYLLQNDDRILIHVISFWPKAVLNNKSNIYASDSCLSENSKRNPKTTIPTLYIRIITPPCSSTSAMQNPPSGATASHTYRIMAFNFINYYLKKNLMCWTNPCLCK